MTPALLLGLRLAVGSGGQRARTLATGAASAAGVVLVLLVWGVAASTLGASTWFHTSGPRTLLLVGTIAMVGLPVVVLVATIARLSASVRDRRLANLRLLGLTAGQTRVVAATEVGTASFMGAAIGSALAAAIAAVGGDVLRSRADLADASLWPPALAWVVVPLAVVTAALVPAVLPQRLPSDRALSQVRQRAGGPVRLVRVVPLVLGFFLCVSPQLPLVDQKPGEVPTWEIVATMVGIALLGIGMLLVIPVFMELIASCLLRFGRGPLTTLVGRRLQTQPASATRVIAALMMGLFIVVAARGVLVVFLATPQYVAAADFVEREQTAGVTTPVQDLQRTVNDLGAIEGVREIAAFPVARGAPPQAVADGSDNVTVVVATCAELATTSEGLPGCSDDAPSLIGDPWFRIDDVMVLHVRASADNAPRGRQVDVDLSRAGVIAPATFEREVGALADTPVVVVPPHTPGIATLLGQTDRMVVAHAGPGRDLYDRVDKAGYRYDSMVDLENYDFVQGMLTMVWILATVVIAIGLATFTIAGIDRAIGRRRELTALRLIGTPHRLLRQAQWLEAALPTVLGCALAITAGAYAGAAYLQRSDSLHVSMGSTLTLAAVATVTSLLLAWVTTVGTGARLEPEHIRAE
jgi:hypothetical protein